MTPRVRLPAESLAFIRRGLSTIVSSRDANHRPSVMRAVGSEVAQDGSLVTVFLARSQARQLLQDIAATGWICVVFSEPSSHRTVQLKASQARMRNAVPDDEPLLARYLASMEQELGKIHIPPPLTRALLAHRLDEVVAVSFTPEQAFDQTPGPRAGTSLAGGA